MNEIKPFQPLQIPAAITISAFTVIALTEMRELDPDSASFDLSTVIASIVLWMTSVGVASWNSPQAQGAASAVFTITALISERIPGSSEYGHDELAGISPTLWVLSGVMCGSAVATCATTSRTSKLRSSLSIKDLNFDKISVAILSCLLASAPLVASSYPRLWVSSGQLGAAVTAFLCGFAMTSLAGMVPFISWIYLAITLGRYSTFDDTAAARTYLTEVLPIPLLAISATAGLITMYHYKKPRPITSSQATESHTSSHQEDTHEE
jgi:membrane protein